MVGSLTVVKVGSGVSSALPEAGPQRLVPSAGAGRWGSEVAWASPQRLSEALRRASLPRSFGLPQRLGRALAGLRCGRSAVFFADGDPQHLRARKAASSPRLPFRFPADSAASVPSQLENHRLLELKGP